MADYDFSTLNDKDLEELTRDLLNKKFGLSLQSFKTGIDGGIDLRYSGTGSTSEIIVQVKHYLKSGYQQLLYKLKTEEYPKVDKLKPKRYIVVTSIELSATQKDSIKSSLAPYIISSDDILGRHDLNALLREFPETEKSWYKLWLSSTANIERILYNGTIGRSDYLKETIEKRLCLYVPTTNLDTAFQILNDNRILLITGAPGVGKTTLAQIIIYHMLIEDYEVTYVENIKEAEDLFSIKPDHKQIFYFDDFLGANYLEITGAGKSETQIYGFIERIRRSKNKFLILTTRTVIYNHARLRFDKIKRSGLQSSEFELKISEYQKFDKARILYNHLFFLDLPIDLKEQVFRDKFYLTIIEHQNYNPRLIEFLTKPQNLIDVTPEFYQDYIFQNLENPDEVWNHSFMYQIEDAHRYFLITLFSIGDYVKEEYFLTAFDCRLNYEKEKHGMSIGSQLKDDVIKTLLGGFVNRSYGHRRNRRDAHFSLINPSLGDYILGLLKKSSEERKRLIMSSFYVDQIEKLHPGKTETKFDLQDQKLLIDRISLGTLEELERGSVGIKDPEIETISIRSLHIIIVFCEELDESDLAKELFEKYLKNRVLLRFDLFKVIIQRSHRLKDFHEYLVEKRDVLLEIVFDGISDLNEATWVLYFFDSMNWDYEEYIKDEENAERLYDFLYDLAEAEKFSSIEENEDSMESIDEVDGIRYDVEQQANEVLDELLLTDSHEIILEDDSNYWKERIEFNQDTTEEEIIYGESYYKSTDDGFWNVRNVDNEINDLFSKSPYTD